LHTATTLSGAISSPHPSRVQAGVPCKVPEMFNLEGHPSREVSKLTR
jgi:hypothetical protein